MVKEIKLTDGSVTLVDDEDFEFLGRWEWRLNNRRYAVIGKGIGNTKKCKGMYMHRIIMEATEREHIDHKNGNGLDNRKENLRICTHAENNRNKKKQANNTSGYKGVVWHKGNKSWIARIKVNQKTINLGYYKDPIKAAKAYDIAAVKHFGEFASLNIYQCKKE